MKYLKKIIEVLTTIPEEEKTDSVFLQKLVTALSSQNPLPPNVDYALYFILSAPPNMGLRWPKEIDAILKGMQNDESFQQEYKNYISSYKNLNQLLLFVVTVSAEQALLKNKSENKNENDLVNEMVMRAEKVAQQKQGKKQFIGSLFQKVLTPNDPLPESNFYNLLRPYHIQYLSRIQNLPVNMQTALVAPRMILAAIQKGFFITSSATEKGYVFTGAVDYHFAINGIALLSRDIFKQLESIADRKTILDIGTGDGSFIRNRNNAECYGLTATKFDVVKFNSSKEKEDFDQHYLIGNAERLQDYLPRVTGKPIRFDYIFSRMTYIHLVDPIGAIVQAYDALKPGGILLIDRFVMHGAQDYYLSIIHELQRQGYRVTAQTNRDEVTSFIIQKTENLKQLIFPCTYQNVVGGEAHYQPSKHLKPDSWHLQEQFSVGVNALADVIKSANLQNKCDQFSDVEKIASYLNDSEFLKLSSFDKHFVILNMVAKITPKEKIDDLQGELQKLFNDKTTPIYVNRLAIGIDGATGFDMTTNILNYDIFKQMDDHNKKRLLILAAQHDILLYGAHANTKQILDKMGLPYQLKPTDYDVRVGIKPAIKQ